MDMLEEPVDQRIERETAALEIERHGEVNITVAKALLGMELILICFVDVSLRTGSRLFVWWVIAEGLLGLLLLGIGLRQKSEAHSTLTTLAPRQASIPD